MSVVPKSVLSFGWQGPRELHTSEGRLRVASIDLWCWQTTDRVSVVIPRGTHRGAIRICPFTYRKYDLEPTNTADVLTATVDHMRALTLMANLVKTSPSQNFGSNSDEEILCSQEVPLEMPQTFKAGAEYQIVVSSHHSQLTARYTQLSEDAQLLQYRYELSQYLQELLAPFMQLQASLFARCLQNVANVALTTVNIPLLNMDALRKEIETIELVDLQALMLKAYKVINALEQTLSPEQKSDVRKQAIADFVQAIGRDNFVTIMRLSLEALVPTDITTDMRSLICQISNGFDP